MNSYNIAIVGATGAVGEEILNVLDEMKFPVNALLPLASAKSAGERVEFRGEEYVVKERFLAQVDLFLHILLHLQRHLELLLLITQVTLECKKTSRSLCLNAIRKILKNGVKQALSPTQIAQQSKWCKF